MFSNCSKFLNSLIQSFLIPTTFALYTSKKFIEFLRRGAALCNALVSITGTISQGLILNLVTTPVEYPLLIASRYSTALVLPISALIGFIGYKIEGWVSDRYTPSLKSVKEKREDRLLNDEGGVDSIKDPKFVPKTIFEKNLSPSLKEPDPRLKKYNKEP